MKVSIITVCKNAQDTIERTIKSVINQDYKNIEYIIIDGKSTDKTLSIINKYKNKISVVISEPDSGIFEAMNKGIRFSTGKIVNFLNAGDLFYKNIVISRIVRLFEKHNPGIDIVYGDAILYDQNNQRNYVLKSHKYVDRISLARWSICHQAMFTKKSVFNKYGDFNYMYKVNGDYEWLLRSTYLKKISFFYTNQVIVKYLIGGSSWSGNRSKFYHERITIAVKYYGLFRFIVNNLIMRIRGKKLYFIVH
ncbi:MAG: glycosyltransferase family 2 protein [bacterium]